MVPLPQKKLHLAVLVTTPSLSWMGRQMWKIWGIRSSKSDERFKKNRCGRSEKEKSSKLQRDFKRCKDTHFATAGNISVVAVVLAFARK